MKPFITLTGLDERTDIDAVERLARPGVEFGILLSETPEGRNRYPSLPWVAATARRLGRRCAIHVCGGKARESLMTSLYDDWLDLVGRVQINGKVADDELDWLLPHFSELTIITQLAGTPAEYLDIHEVTMNHAILVDGSGGRGISPAEWPTVPVVKDVGFAGGLGPDNIATELPRIRSIACSGWWVDMESKLRDAEDWFSLKRCADVIAKARPFIGESF